MRKSLYLSLLFLNFVPFIVCAIDIHNTRLLSQPAISANHIAFIYAEDLWVANLDGSSPRRLTVSEGIESNPRFSPDGKIIAFSGQYDGNTDVYIIPIEGGSPKRLTWHPAADAVKGFTPDGKSVLFSSPRFSFNNRYTKLFTVAVNGGPENELEIPNAYHATYSPDGKYIAYTPLADAFLQWKHYRGGSEANIYLFSIADKSIVKIPQPAGGCNDTQPIWLGGKIYFRSDRNNEFNLYSYDVSSKEIKQLTYFKDFPVLYVSGDNHTLILEQSGYLHTYDIESQKQTQLTIGVAADLIELRPRYAANKDYVRSADISPSGARVVFDYRGDIVTAPAEKGDYHNITNTPGVHETYPAWSPNGKYIAYFSDAGGEYKLCIKAQDENTPARDFRLNGTGFYAFPKWSPDSKKISFVDNGRNLYVLDTVTGNVKKIDADDIYIPGAFRNLFGDWSADSKWIAYTKVTNTQFKRAYLYSLAEGQSHAVTDALSDVSEPHFDRNKKFLYFFASTDAGPVINWFDQSNVDFHKTNSIYLLTLQKETISPFAKENDEEIAQKQDLTAHKLSAVKKNAATPVEDNSLNIDWDGIQTRVIAIPVKADNYDQLSVDNNGNLLYMANTDGGPDKLHKFDFKKRKDSEVLAVSEYTLSADGKKMLIKKDGQWLISNAGEKPDPEKGPVKVSDIQIQINPAAEWANIYNEAWRVNRDYFYDPGMHGNNWEAIRNKYAVFLPQLTCRNDLNNVLQWMLSELAVGHEYITNRGERLFKTQRVPGGLLGADFYIDKGKYKFKKIYGGLNWTPDLRSPLTEPGVNIKQGEYLLAVNGHELLADENLYRYFENTAGKITELTVGANANFSGSRTVNVVPIESEAALRNREWVEDNLRKVTEATNGQVAYVYVPNTANEGHEYFKRYFYPQANRKAVIVDERFNGGGSLADYYINLLLNPYQANWHTRYGNDIKSPSASIQGPKVMITDETAGSGGDMLPWMFRKFKVGTLVGKRTWGGLVGILDYPELIDGGQVTAPNIGIWTKDGFVVENVGVAPDVEVEQEPAEIIKGNDPQLQRAIEIALKELKENPQPIQVRPPFPVKVQKEK